jgi:hypothetical protein
VGGQMREYQIRFENVGLRRWVAIRENQEYKNVGERRLRAKWHLDYLKKYNFLLKDYPPKENETYEDWCERCNAIPNKQGIPLYVFHTVNVQQNKIEYDFFDFHKQWRTILPIPTDVKYPHPLILEQLTSFPVEVLGNDIRKNELKNCYEIRNNKKIKSKELLVKISFDYTVDVIEKSLRQIIKSYKQGNGKRFSGMPTISRREANRFYDCVEIFKLLENNKSSVVIKLMGWEEEYKKNKKRFPIYRQNPIVNMTYNYAKAGKSHIENPWNIV